MARLDGKVALITGGASGFGAASGKIFAREGAKVVLTDKNTDGAQAVAREIGNAASAMSHDVVSEDDWKRVVADTFDMHGKLDILMNNAGVMGTGAPQDIENMSLDEWKFVQEINSDGVFLGCRAVIQAMKDSGGGSIINIASILGLRQAGAVLPYAVSKAGVVQMTKVMALELARHGIRVNALAPGYLDTELNRAFWETDAGRALIRRVPQRRLGQLEDLDGPLLLLASDGSRFMTGAVIAVDGGHLVSSL